MGKLVLKDESVDLGTTLAPAGARILEVLKKLAPTYDFDIVITCGREAHKPEDPHTKGEAFDVRSQGLNSLQKQALLSDLRRELYKEPRLFYAFLEAPGTLNEHIHIQRRLGRRYSMIDYLNSR